MLVAISIPIFTSQLEKSRDAVSISNVRSAYAEAQTAYLTASTVSDGDQTIGNAVVTVSSGKITKIVISNVSIKSQKNDSWSGEAAELPEGLSSLADPGTAGASYKLTLNYDADGKITSASLSTT